VAGSARRLGASMQPLEQTTRPRGAGGTPGGIGEFLLGLGMAVAGGYWLTSSVTVSSGYWTFWGHNAFGLSLVAARPRLRDPVLQRQVDPSDGS
jgi:hypothetical protein